VLASLFLTCAVALGGASVLLFVLGHRIRFASRLVGVLFGAVVVAAAGETAARVWDLPSRYVEVGQLILLASIVLVVLARSAWNPIGQVFFATFVASIGTYLAAALVYTVASGLSPAGIAASGLLFTFELVALLLACSFAFESCDVVCRTRWTRTIQPPDPTYLPKVSLQIAAYNEPPDMLIETIASAERIDYPNFEILVIDNNTKDPEVWRPVEEYCRDRDRVRFVHVDPWPGFKSGALNLALTEHTAPDAEIVGVIDADYLVDPDYLRSVVGYFIDPNIAFVQTPQDYREYERDSYLTACYDAYRYFFTTSMPSRNERNSIIFAGTMGLLRRSVLEGLGGWDEWCITEDAETSLRMLKEGYSGLFIPTAYGQGIMPLTFASLKSQRFRWCFGGMQILRRHWRELMPWDRDPKNRLSIGQRFDYLVSGLQWFNDLVNLAFTVVLLTMGAVFLSGGEVGIRPLDGAVVLLPVAIIASGLLRALWALRQRTGIGGRRALLAFANWLSLSWTVSLACVQGLLRAEGVFMRTPKANEGHRLMSALWSARTESIIAAAIWATGIAVVVSQTANAFVAVLFAWQGSVYASAPFMSWLNQHTELSAQLERRRRSEVLRERLVALRPYYLGTAAIGVAAAVVAIVVLSGGSSQPTRTAGNPFALPKASANDEGPLGNLIDGDAGPTEEPTTTTDTTVTTDTSTGSPTTAPATTTPATTAPATTAPATTTTTPATSTTTTTLAN
jgi:cellulose synthase/poly-beta-1,6-N-acetylglucosamine synthase-like glycosyltransferase